MVNLYNKREQETKRNVSDTTVSYNEEHKTNANKDTIIFILHI